MISTINEIVLIENENFDEKLVERGENDEAGEFGSWFR